MLAGALRETRRRSTVMVVCWLAYMVIYLLRSNLAVALPYIEAEFGINKTSLGLLGSMFMWVYGVGHLVHGNVGDRFSAKLFIAIGVLMSAVMNVLFVLARQYWQMVLLWGLNGWFAAMLWGPIAKTIARWYPPQRRGSIVVAVSTSMTTGGLISLLLSGLLAGEDTWRWIFFAPACIAAVFLCIHLIAFRDEPEAGRLDVRGDDAPEARRVKMRDLLTKTRIRYIIISCFAQGIVKDGISLWAMVYFVESYGLDIKSAMLTVILIPVMNLLGVLSVGWLQRRYPGRMERLTACTFGLGAALMALLILLGGRSLPLAMIVLALASAAMYGANTLLLGVFPMQYAYCGRVSAMAGFLDFCAYVASGFAAVLSGLMIDRLGWGGVMALWLAVAGIGMAALIVAENSRVTYELPESEE